jgi:hypothetical protein
MSESLFEYTALHDRTQRERSLRIDRAAHRLRGVKILGFASTNGRTYELEAVRRALPLYEGTRVNINHPPGAAPAPRDYHDRLGSLVDVRLDEAGGLFGDLFYNPKHPLAEQLLWDAEHAPHHVGLSHNVLARTARRGDTVAVTEIVSVVSVDLVADPATTRGLFENEHARVAGDEQREDPEVLTSSTNAEEQSTNLSLSNPKPESNPLSRGLTSPAQESDSSKTQVDSEQSELDTLREQLTAALLREAGLREELERRREAAPRPAAQPPRSREQAAELLRRGPELTREQALWAFVAAVKRR